MSLLSVMSKSRQKPGGLRGLVVGSSNRGEPHLSTTSVEDLQEAEAPPVKLCSINGCSDSMDCICICL